MFTMQPDPLADQLTVNREDELIEPELRPLTPEEAAQWRSRQPVFSIWHLVGAQALVMLLAGGFSWLFTQRASVGWSVLYGGLCIFLPTTLMAYGLTSSAWSRWQRASVSPKTSASLGSLFFWEGVKIVLALIMMWSAPQVIPDLSWLGLLLGLVLVLKMGWLVLLWRRPSGQPQPLVRRSMFNN